MCKSVQPEIHNTIMQHMTNERSLNLNIAELQRIERQMIPLLNTIRLMQGKRPVIVPGDKRVNGG